MLVKIGFLSLENCDGSLGLLILCFLSSVTLFHFFLRSQDFIDEGLTDVSGLLGQILLEFLLFMAERLDLIAVKVELLIQCLGGLLETGDLALEGCIKCVTLICCGCHLR